MKQYILGVLLGVIVTACNQRTDVKQPKSGLEKSDFQRVVDGDSTDLFVLTNAAGMEACITNYGGRIVSLMVPDREGIWQDVVMGFDHIDAYLVQPSSFGATIGRFANRIANGRFVLDGDTLMLDKNSGEHTIHGGGMGWRGQVFDAVQPNDSTLALSYISPDGEAGFPGTVRVEVTFSLTEGNRLIINYEAQTDKKTVINLTNHSFFNLSGDPANSILDNELYVNARRYTPMDTSLITTGALAPVAETPFDFTTPRPIGEQLAVNSTHQQLLIAQGIDHNFVLDTKGAMDTLAAKLYDRQHAICLEVQHFPDSPNKPQWPTTVLTPGDTFSSTCIYQFGVANR